MTWWLSFALPTVAARDEPHTGLPPVLLPSAWSLGIGDGSETNPNPSPHSSLTVHPERDDTCTESHAQLCEHSLSSAVDGTFTEITLPDGTNATHVATGDIGDMWI